MQVDDLIEGVRGRFTPERVRGLLHGLIALLAVGYLLLFLDAALHRMRFPFEVEWIESNMLVSVLRIAHGKGLYVAPSLSFVPYLYAPLYLYLAAALSKWVHGYAALRLLSVLSTLGACAAIYGLVRSETARRIPALAAATLYLASYAILGTFFDIGRVDALFVFLLLLALLAQRRGHVVLAALVWVLVFQTKQTVLPLAVLILLAEWQRPRRAIAGVVTFLAVAAGSIVLLNRATGGWYGFYIFHVARGLPIVWRQVVLYWSLEVMEPLAIAWSLMLTALLLTSPRYRNASFPLVVSVALFGGIWFVASHRGASINALMPVYAWVAVLFGIAVARLLDWAAAREWSRAEPVILAAAALQLFVLLYNPGRFIPTRDHLRDSERFLAQLRAIPGDVYVLNHSYDAAVAGKQPHAEGEALGAVLDAHLGAVSADLRRDLDSAVSEHRYAAIVVDDVEPTDTAWHFENTYPLAYSTTLTPYRSMTSQANWFLLPCDASPAVRAAVSREDSEIAAHRCEIALAGELDRSGGGRGAVQGSDAAASRHPAP